MRVLFTSPIIEHPPKGGPQLRIENTVKALHPICELHHISQVPKYRLGAEQGEKFFRKFSHTFLYAPSVYNLLESKWPRRFQKLIRFLLINNAAFIVEYAKKHKINIIWFGFGNLSYPLIESVHKANKKLKLICDTDSVWSRFLERESPFIQEAKQKAILMKEVKQKQSEEKNWVELCDITTAVSEVDAEYYLSLTNYNEKIQLFPNAIDFSYYSQEVKPIKNFSRHSIILSGTFGRATSPMNRATNWVLEEIWPKVLKNCSKAHLYIIGNHSDVSFGHAKSSSISVEGRVESILPYLKHASLAITPLQFESGTRFKILEAAACKTAMVSTTLGAEGLPVEDKKDILIADTAEKFSQAIQYCLEKPDFAKYIAINSYKKMKSLFDLCALQNYAQNILSQLESI